MERLRDWALKLIIALNLIALTVSFAESFSGLYQWALHHSVEGWQTAIWPLMIDVIVLAGEAGLFVAHKDHWRVRDKVWLWFVTLTALSVSMAANIGHVESTDWLSHLTAALPPLALFFTMTVGFGVMKRVYLNKPAETARPAYTGSESRAPLTPPETVLTPFERISDERSHVGSQALIENALPGFARPAETLTETPAEITDVPEQDLSETLAKLGFKVTEKSYSQPRDTREGLTLPERRVRDMYDVDPEITPNNAATNLGISWATAKKYLEATKEARTLTA